MGPCSPAKGLRSLLHIGQVDSLQSDIVEHLEHCFQCLRLVSKEQSSRPLEMDEAKSGGIKQRLKLLARR